MKVIIVVFLLLLCSIGGASAWYDGFNYRIPITIDNAGNPALEDYQFNVSFSPGINETSIRVVNDTDYTIVPHWCENETVGTCYELWFNVSVGSEVNTDYYIYYGNDSISSTSDYDDTFTKKYNDSGLVLELHMDEGTGNAVMIDSSGEGNGGTLTNMNVTGNDTSGWQGADGGQWDSRNDVVFSNGDHLRFDGVNDYVNCGNDQSLNPTEEISTMFWIYPKNLTSTQRILNKYLSTDRTYSIIISSLSKLHAEYWDTDGVSITPVAAYTLSSTNQWYHITTVFDGDTSEIYVNGNIKNTQNVGGKILKTSSANLDIGRYSGGVQFFNGSLDEVRIYNRSLSGDEIYRQYIRSKYAANTPTICIGYTEEIPHPFLSGAYLFYGEMTTGLTSFEGGIGRYLIWGVVFFAVSLAFTLIAKIKTTLIGGK